MGYCVQADILEQIPETELIQLTDDGDLGAVDESIVTRAIADADSEIDGYCGNRYTVPFVETPDMVRKLSVDIAIYNLYSRRQGAPENRQKRYDDAVSFLRRVSDGKASVPGATGTDESASDRVSLSGPDRVFSRDNLEGF
jgi:phage gp36-like protein